MSDTSLRLGGEFPPADHAEWVALAETSLRGKTLASLVTTTLDDIGVQPLYTTDDVAQRPAPGLPGFEPYVRGGRASGSAPNGWDVRQHFGHPDPAAQNEAVLAGLNGGATSLWVRVDDAVDLPRMLEGVLLDLAPVALDAGHVVVPAAHRLAELWQSAGIERAEVGGSFRADPIGLLARTGVLQHPLDRHFDELVELVELARGFGKVRALAADATVFADAGASDADELACSLAVAVAVLRALDERGVSADVVGPQLEFSYSATADQFATIAKLRAARRLWSRVAQSCGIAADACRQSQHAVSSSTMLTRHDPWVNLLRVTVASFAAGVAGADAVTATPFDAALGVPDEFGRRLARNTQALLLEEANVHRLIDPAGGSWYVESLTDELAKAAWVRFQEIEADGGIVEQLRSGALARHLDVDWRRRLESLSTRRSALTGISEFPDLDETPVVRAADPGRRGPTTGHESVDPLPRRRLAAPFEALRDAADATSASVFCANLGPPAVHTARTSWASNFFAVGGVHALDGGSYPDAAAAAEAFARSGARIAVICSSDEVYVDQAADAAVALRGAGAERIYLAGNPRETRAALEEAGVDEFVHVGIDVLAALRGVHDALGIAPVEERS